MVHIWLSSVELGHSQNESCIPKNIFIQKMFLASFRIILELYLIYIVLRVWILIAQMDIVIRKWARYRSIIRIIRNTKSRYGSKISLRAVALRLRLVNFRKVSDLRSSRIYEH